MPIVIQLGFPEDPTYSDELVWLITLAPAFLLSLHYGLKGAFAALMAGTLLFLIVQTIVALSYTPDDWRITVPTYVAYGTLSISVGWLSDQLHDYYGRLVQQERLAAVGKLALAVKHEINNTLAAIAGNSQLLILEDENLSEDQRQSAQHINQAVSRLAQSVERLTDLRAPEIQDDGP
jgi:signal transduction histidine kinase